MQNTSPHSTLRILQTPGPKGSNGDSLLENLEARVRVQQGLTQQDHAAVPQAVTAKVQTSQGFIFIKICKKHDYFISLKISAFTIGSIMP